MKSNLEQLRALTGKLADFETMLSAFFDLSPDLFAVMHWEIGQKNSDVMFDIVNPAWYDVLGYTTTEMTQESYLNKIHPKDRQDPDHEIIPEYDQGAMKLAVEKARAEGIDFDLDRKVQLAHYVQRWVHKDGSTRVISWNANFDFVNRVCYIVGRDLTGSYDDYEAVRRYRHNLRNIAEDYLTDAIGMLELSRERIRGVETGLNQYEPPIKE